MKAVLLSAGLGTRLLPITKKISKQMIPIAGKPLLEYIIRDLVSCGIDHICIVVGHLENQIKEYFHEGEKFNLKIQYVLQKNYKGTADAILYAKDFVGNDPFLLYHADTIISPDFINKINQMKNSSYDVEILTSKVPESLLNSVGTVVTDKKNFVIQIDEKSNQPKSKLGWSGVAIFNNNTIFEEITKLDFQNSEEVNITDGINRLISLEKTVHNSTCSSFIDSGTPNGLLTVSKYILKEKILDVENKLKNSKITKPTFIGKNCDIENDCLIGPYTSIENNVLIHEHVTIQNSIILDDVEISPNQKIIDKIFSKHGNLSAT